MTLRPPSDRPTLRVPTRSPSDPPRPGPTPLARAPMPAPAAPSGERRVARSNPNAGPTSSPTRSGSNRPGAPSTRNGGNGGNGGSSQRPDDRRRTDGPRPPRPATQRPEGNRTPPRNAPQRPAAPAPVELDTSGVRLSKCVAELKACSRREAEQYIEGGWVRVAGIVIEEPQFRVHDEAVDIDPHASLMALAPVTLLLHKPPGLDAGTHEPISIKGLGKGIREALALITPASQAADSNDGRPLVPLLKKHLTKQVLCLPLESAASGLVVYTQDWRIERKLVEDAHVIEQEFTIEVEGEVPPDTLDHLNHGLNDGGHPLPPVKVSVSSTGEGHTRLRCALKGVHPGLIAYLCDRVGLKILSLKRIRVGRLPLSTVAVGEWRFLQPYERF